MRPSVPAIDRPRRPAARAGPAHLRAPTCHDPRIAPPRFARRRRPSRALAATVLTLAVPLAVACGSAGEDRRGLGRVPESERIQHDPAGDVADGFAMQRAMENDHEVDLEKFRKAFTDERPELDLREAQLTVEDDTLRLRVETEAAIGRSVFALSTTRPGCGDDQLDLVIGVGEDGAATVDATDVAGAELRPVPDADMEVDGARLTLTLPLLATPEVGRWYLVSGDRPLYEDEGPDGPAGYGDQLPDMYITGAYFTRGTGTPNYAEPAPCGPPDPPLLPR